MSIDSSIRIANSYPYGEQFNQLECRAFLQFCLPLILQPLMPALLRQASFPSSTSVSYICSTIWFSCLPFSWDLWPHEGFVKFSYTQAYCLCCSACFKRCIMSHNCHDKIEYFCHPLPNFIFYLFFAQNPLKPLMFPLLFVLPFPKGQTLGLS